MEIYGRDECASTPLTFQGRPARLSLLGAAMAVLLLLSTAAPAQERFGNFIGSVTDATGASIPDVNVTLTNKETHRVLTTTTDASGAYVFRQVEAGHYSFTFDRTGFSRYEVPEALVSVGQEIKVSATLQVSGTTQTVEVSEAAPLIDTTTVLKATNISAEEFDNLPKTRSFQSVAALSPSVNFGPFQSVEAGYQINGASAAENQFYIDGVTTTSLINGQSRENAAFEFLQEVQVKTGGLDAEYGGALGGVVSAVTRSGGNAFHGEAHYYFAGNGISAGPVKRLLLLNPYDPTGTNARFVQDHKNDSNTHEFGGSLGGYFWKNKLYFFSSVSPQLTRQNNLYLFTGEASDSISRNTTNQQLFNKVTFTPVNSLRVNLSWLWTPTRVEGAPPAYSGEGNYLLTSRTSIQPNKQLGWTQPQNNYSGQVDWTITPTSILTIKGGRYWDNFRTWGVPPIGSVTFRVAPSTAGIAGLPPELANAQSGYSNTPRQQQTFFDIATRSYIQADYSKYVGRLLGSHDLKLGVGTLKSVNKIDSGYPQNGYTEVYWGQPFQGQQGQYGYYTVTNFGTRGSVGANITNLYIQDHWRIHPRVSITLGLRTENERIPSFNPVVDDINFSMSQKLSPRLGVAWDVFGNGKLKGFASFNRLYGWVPWETARGAFGGDFYTVYYRSLDTLDVLSLSGNNMPGRNLWPSGPFRNRRVLSPADPDLKPMATNLTNVGFEYELMRKSVLRVNYNRNHLIRTIEDMGVVENGDEVYTLVNPGFGLGKVMHSSSATPDFFPTPRAIRNYDALEVSLTRRFGNNFFASASYVYSRLYGNYTGTANTDEILTPTTGVSSGTSQQFSGSVARAGLNASRAWDVDETMFDAHGQVVNGRLPTDRPHVLKLFGNYSFKWGTEMGLFFLGESGTPVTTRVETVNTIPVVVEGRGDYGRTPILTQTDMLLAQEFKFGETKRLRFEFNALNLFNQKTVRHIFDQVNRGANTTSAAYALIDLSNTNLFQGYDWRGMLSAINAKSGNPYDPRFGLGDLFNPGFAGRFGVKFIF